MNPIPLNETSCQPSRRAARRDRKGATLVEFAIIVVPMFTLIFACIEVGRVCMIDSLAEDAAFECLRHVMVAGATKAEAVTKAEEYLDLLGTQGYTVTVTPYNGTSTQGDIDDDTDEVHVDITVNMSANTFVLSWFTSGITLRKSANILTERYKGFYDGTSS
jgi:Flp pilus assembly protein TadG